MAQKKLAVVVGATGLQGGSVVQTLLSDGSWKVRGITRKASSSSAKALSAQGVEMVEANLNDASSLKKAFAGAHVIFGVTDFWALYLDEANRSKVKPGQAMNEWAFEAELQQGKNIFDAAAGVPSLERLVFSSLSNANKESGGKYTKVLHFDGKALAVDYGESTYPELFAKTSVIQLGLYLTNLYNHPWMMPHKNEETGTYDFALISGGTSPGPMVAAEKDTGTLTKALISAAPGKNLAAFRQWMSISDYVKLWSEIVGVEGRIIKKDLDQMPPDLKEELEETFAFAEEFDFFGRSQASVIDPQDLDANLNLGTVEEWIREQDWSHIIKS